MACKQAQSIAYYIFLNDLKNKTKQKAAAIRNTTCTELRLCKNRWQELEMNVNNQGRVERQVWWNNSSL